MKNKISIEKPIINKNKITYYYKIDGLWKEAFEKKNQIDIEYSIDISSIPIGIAIIPFLANLLPMAWVYDAEIITPVCDKVFYDSIEDFKDGYKKMYPMMELKGKVIVETLEKNIISKSNRRSAAFFSGGVDAFNTLVCHVKEKPVLLTLWGADVKLNDTRGWENVLTHLQETSKQFSIEYVTIKSEFRMFQNENVLTNAVRHSGDGWWHGFQHGVGIICHAAPVAWVLGISTVYFASSFTVKDKGKVTCASDPTIDNFIKFGITHIVHDGYEYTRQMKIHNITKFSRDNNIKIPLRVCWESTGGSNCCRCEKCWRTMLGIYAEKQDPKEYGFDISNRQLGKISRKMRYGNNKMFGALRYAQIQQAMHKNCRKWDVPKQIRWFYDADINYLGREKEPVLLKFAKKIKKKIKMILGR